MPPRLQGLTQYPEPLVVTGDLNLTDQTPDRLFAFELP